MVMTETQREMARILGENVHRLRKEIGMKQETLAELAGYRSRTNISHIERGEQFPSIERALLIAKALNVPVDVLYKEYSPTTNDPRVTLTHRLNQKLSTLPVTLVHSLVDLVDEVADIIR